MPNVIAVRDVERWTLSVVEGLLRGDRSEDSRVEFKRELRDDFLKLARRLAGHANAARGEPILWVVGVDEDKRQLTSAVLPTDAANLWQQVWSKFDGPHPEVVDVHVEFGGATLLALGFNCERVPYVVQTGKDAPRLELPWREGTRVDSATRSQLIRVMLPAAKAPTVEVRRTVVDHGGVSLVLFVVPPTPDPIMLPQHRVLLDRAGTATPAYELHANAEGLTQPHPVVREVKGQGVYLYGPAEVVTRWRIGTSQPPYPSRVRLCFEPGAIEVTLDDAVPPR
jgi:hypothetical protein